MAYRSLHKKLKTEQEDVKPGCALSCPGKVSLSSSSSGIRRATLSKNPVIYHNRAKTHGMVATTYRTLYTW